MHISHFENELPTAVLGAQHPKLFFLKKNIKIDGELQKKHEIAKKGDFNFNDTYNAFRRGLKNGLKKSVFQKMKNFKISIPTLGESIRFRERE